MYSLQRAHLTVPVATRGAIALRALMWRVPYPRCVVVPLALSASRACVVQSLPVVMAGHPVLVQTFLALGMVTPS